MTVGIIKSVSLHILSCLHRHLLFPCGLWLNLSASLAVALKPSLMPRPSPLIASHSLNIDIPFILSVVLRLSQTLESFFPIKCVSVFYCHTRSDMSLMDFKQCPQWVFYNTYLRALLPWSVICSGVTASANSIGYQELKSRYYPGRDWWRP